MNFIKNRTVIGITCIVLSLIICFAITPLFNKAITEKADIIRVTKDIKAGEKISKDMISIVSIGVYNLPQDVLKNKASVMGKYTTADLYKNDYILASKVTDEPQAEDGYLNHLDGKKGAISISVSNFAKGLSGKLKSGDIISIISAMQMGDTIIPPELKYVEVIAVTASSGYDANTDHEEVEKTDEKQLPATVTLLATKEQAKVLAGLEAQGNVHVTLIYRGTQENRHKFIKEQDKVLNEIYFTKIKEDQVGQSEDNQGSRGEVDEKISQE